MKEIQPLPLVDRFPRGLRRPVYVAVTLAALAAAACGGGGSETRGMDQQNGGSPEPTAVTTRVIEPTPTKEPTVAATETATATSTSTSTPEATAIVKPWTIEEHEQVKALLLAALEPVPDSVNKRSLLNDINNLDLVLYSGDEAWGSVVNEYAIAAHDLRVLACEENPDNEALARAFFAWREVGLRLTGERFGSDVAKSYENDSTFYRVPEEQCQNPWMVEPEN